MVMALALPALGWAQGPASPATPPPPTATQGGDPNSVDGNACAPTKPTNPNSQPGVTTGQSGQSDSAPLSDKLAAGKGVLCPPAGVDPEIRAPTPDVGRTPVIRPPGSPGGDQSVQPK